jgi:Ca2+-binding RTX toxin-like protein
VFEAAGEGDDLVVAFSSFALIAGHSVETLSAAEGSANINLTGNELGQSIYGNAGNNVLTTGGGADYLAGGAGNDVFALTNAAGVSTIADYSAGDVVDVTQYLNVANGTDIVAGGYVKINAAGQLQVDINGGADNFATIASVPGSGAVTLRYVSGGNLADVSVSRSAGQAEAVVAKAALGTDAAAVDADHAAPLDDWHSFTDVAAHEPIALAPHLDMHGII